MSARGRRDAVSSAAVASALATLTRHGRTFRLAGTLLPRGMLQEAAELYAFCRHVDDLADTAPDPVQARRSLLAVRRAVLSREVGDTVLAPEVVGFRGLVLRRGLDPAIAATLIDTMIGDLGPVRIADQAGLLRYAYGAAGTVGLLMCRLLGVSLPQASPHALDLGVAMQLTNIARDVTEDAGRDRVYLPAEWLTSGLQIGTAAMTQPHAVFAAVERVLALADLYYESGQRGLAYLPWRPRLAIGAAASVYREIGRRILRAGPAYLAQPRCVVPQGRRLMMLGRSLPVSLSRRRSEHHDARLHQDLQGGFVRVRAGADRAAAE